MSIFNNPMIESAKKSMTPEQIDLYKKIGEEYFKDINFTGNTQSDINLKQKIDLYDPEYILESVKSGLHPKFLLDIEKQILSDKYGTNWYIDFGYIENDLK